MKKVIITGGLGYIGSHTVLEFCKNEFEVIIIDNLSNSHYFILEKLEQLSNKKIQFYKTDLCDIKETEKIFEEHKNTGLVIHFAAFKSVNESVNKPLKYFNNNIISLLNLLSVMEKYNCKNMVFSSSCTVYGDPEILPVSENAPNKKSLSSYGSTKQIGEEILEKLSQSKEFNIISLRYFNPVGAHISGKIGEMSFDKPNNVMPLITKTAIGIYNKFTVFGSDYPTKDGTCVRDYIHVMDLANAHLVASERILNNQNKNNYEIFNIGTGVGYSVLELINAFEKENNVKLNYEIGERRKGDVAEIYADPSKAESILKWVAKKSINDMVVDAWLWEKNCFKKIK